MQPEYDNTIARVMTRLEKSSSPAPVPQLTLHDGLTQILELLQVVDTYPCGIAHHRPWINGGTLVELCSDWKRERSLHCAHTGRSPLRHAILDLHAIGFITEPEMHSLQEIVDARAIREIDNAANYIESLVDKPPSNRTDADFLGQALIKLELPLNEFLTPETAERATLRLQTKAGRPLVVLHKNLYSAVEYALSALPSVEKAKQVFRAAVPELCV
jgi:hypothetical protein